jgi:hypothetical protein
MAVTALADRTVNRQIVLRRRDSMPKGVRYGWHDRVSYLKPQNAGQTIFGMFLESLDAFGVPFFWLSGSTDR